MLVSNRADEVLVEGIKVQSEYPFLLILADAVLILFTVSQAAAGQHQPVLEIRPNREFSAAAGKASLLNLDVVSGAEYVDEMDDDGNSDNNNNDNFQRENAFEANAGNAGPGLANAYNFMRLRRRKMSKTPASTFINSLRLGGSVSTESDRSVSRIISSC